MLLFIDEIHRWSRNQQDALLPHVESGLIVLVGATTENPSFSINPALRSRCWIIELEPLNESDIITALQRGCMTVHGGCSTSSAVFCRVTHEALHWGLLQGIPAMIV